MGVARKVREIIEQGDLVCLFEPPSLDARIVAQAAAFTLCSDKTRSLNQVLMESGLASALMRFIIPSGAVSLIRD